MHIKLFLSAFIANAIFLAVVIATETSHDYEDEPVLDSISFIQPALLSGPGFTVDSRVEIRGYMAHFTLDTQFGPLQADSIEILTERATEIPALEILDKITHSSAFIKATSSKLEHAAEALGNVGLHPFDTLTGLPAGVARYFGQKLNMIGARAQALSDQTAYKFGTAGDPYPPSSGPMTDNRASAHSTSEPPVQGHWYDRLSNATKREVKRRLKHNQIKRELAEQLSIDPYTGNPYVQERLDRLAWAGAGGHFAAGAALGAVGGVGSLLLGHAAKANELVWTLPPDDLRERNHERLRVFCHDELLMRQFLRHDAFTLTLQTALVSALETLKPMSGSDALLELAMSANSALESRFLINNLNLIAIKLGPRAQAGVLRIIGAGLAYETAEHEWILPLAVDYLSWTQQIESFLDRPEFRVTKKTALISGQATLHAQQELTQRGWNIEFRN